MNRSFVEKMEKTRPPRRPKKHPDCKLFKCFFSKKNFYCPLLGSVRLTVRRPPRFYAHLLDLETRAAREEPARVRPSGPRVARPAPRARRAGRAGRGARRPAAAALALGDPRSLVLAGHLDPTAAARAMGLLEPARLSQLRTAHDGQDGFATFPVGQVDADEQQVDLRATNSWRKPQRLRQEDRELVDEVEGEAQTAGRR